MSEVKSLQADWCGKCDEVNMIAQCEQQIYCGPTETGQYHLYCHHCGTKVDFSTYWDHVSDEELAFWISTSDLVLNSIKDSAGFYFNEAYVQSRIDILKRVVDKECIAFAENKDNYNSYGLMLMTRMLWELRELQDEHQGKHEQHKPDSLSLGRLAVAN